MAPPIHPLPQPQRPQLGPRLLPGHPHRPRRRLPRRENRRHPHPRLPLHHLRPRIRRPIPRQGLQLQPHQQPHRQNARRKSRQDRKRLRLHLRQHRHGRHRLLHQRIHELGRPLRHHQLQLRRHQPHLPRAIRAVGDVLQLRRFRRPQKRRGGHSTQHETHFQRVAHQSHSHFGRPRCHFGDRPTPRHPSRLRLHLRHSLHLPTARPRMRPHHSESHQVLRRAQHRNGRSPRGQNARTLRTDQINPEHARKYHVSPHGLHDAPDHENDGIAHTATIELGDEDRHLFGIAPQSVQSRLSGVGEPSSEGVGG
mmetsp:Transcript_28205/g.57811  ORF Transcript_28205/g.57811 Transcript_28205/m.57811 type:complete len:310 (-) Transcript_28205:560-1489(-)